MSDPLTPTDADTRPTGADAVPPSEPVDWQETKSALKWPMIVLFGLPMVILACGLLLFFLSYRIKPSAAPAKPAAVATAPAPQADKDAQIAELRSQIASLQGQLAHPADAAVPAQPPVYTADPTALTQLSARLDRIEENQRVLAKATASAFAARTLQLAAKNQQPFLSELAVVEAGLDDASLAAALRPYAEKGVPSEITLAVQFPAAAAKANIADKTSDREDSLIDTILHAIGGFISIRRTDNPNGQGTQAILQRAEIRLNGGDLKGAVAYLDTLPPAVQSALGPWLAQARARVLVDDATRRISETALNRLSQMTREPLNNGGVL
ncbi:hypothetical protein [Asticcacaulis sp. 201]|uniref:COG4223 family protein n=1 Tax=Asticcacaulis sp. 201 TaxID=3028787 RepID=UPI002916BCEB|nr:hypothetical protein [Asticcacaulis sp. 201]MDV6332353.1 hypothetical protein [Asticcacaulis sp. 201]